jgi:hypothetical protein
VSLCLTHSHPHDLIAESLSEACSQANHICQLDLVCYVPFEYLVPATSHALLTAPPPSPFTPKPIVQALFVTSEMFRERGPRALLWLYVSLVAADVSCEIFLSMRVNPPAPSSDPPPPPGDHIRAQKFYPALKTQSCLLASFYVLQIPLFLT